MRKLPLFLVIVFSCGLILTAAPIRVRRTEPAPATTRQNQNLTAGLLGPLPYRSFTDSPFASMTFDSFYLEDFEDGVLSTPGVIIDKGFVTGSMFGHLPHLIDSVDGDDGNPVNGACSGCDSYFYGQAHEGLRISFTGPLPTHVGVVWTDGLGTTSFEAFDENGASLGVVGPVAIADADANTAFGEDRFFGAMNDDGISAMRISNTQTGIEIDHLQYGYPSTLPTGLLGPLPYRSFADSPFASLTFGTFYLEDFEDGLLNTPIVAIDNGYVTSTAFSTRQYLIDSVDGDDGNAADGACSGCDSYFFGQGWTGLRISFNEDAALPTHVGVVWTDGLGLATFEAFDRHGISLGVIGPVPVGDGTFNTSTGEDRFFGAMHDEGISSVFISSGPTEGIEIDHLQYGFPEVCGDADGDGFGVLTAAICPGGGTPDCNDANDRISPAEPEIYDGIDNNCNMQVDEGLDDDGDGIPNFRDECSNTRPGAGVTPDGCPRCGDGGDDDDDDDDDYDLDDDD